MSSALVTGGAGYIGSHAVLLLLENDWDVVVVDNLSNSDREVLRRIEQISGKTVNFQEVDITDKLGLDHVFAMQKFDVVFHFAGLKSVNESNEKPIEYYQNNVSGTLNVLEIMKKHEVFNLIFSSSATVYGHPDQVPIPEHAATSTTNPYGATKLTVEKILDEVAASDTRWSFGVLRYFNPVGAHSSGLIGEDPKGIPNNLVPYVSQVAVGKLEKLTVFGADYPTKDGTGVRDYIHVMDLVKGHLAAWKVVKKGCGVHTYNLGTGKGVSVLELIAAYEKLSGRDIPYNLCVRRAGDVAECYADPSLAYAELNWKAEYSLENMLADSWNWQTKNPDGY